MTRRHQPADHALPIFVGLRRIFLLSFGASVLLATSAPPSRRADATGAASDVVVVEYRRGSGGADRSTLAVYPTTPPGDAGVGFDAGTDVGPAVDAGPVAAAPLVLRSLDIPDLEGGLIENWHTHCPPGPVCVMRFAIQGSASYVQVSAELSDDSGFVCSRGDVLETDTMVELRFESL